MATTITLPIKCSTVKILHQVLSEIATVIGVLLPFVGTSMIVASWYIITYVHPIIREVGHIWIDDTAFYLGLFGWIAFGVGGASFICIIGGRYSFSCIKDDEVQP